MTTGKNKERFKKCKHGNNEQNCDICKLYELGNVIRIKNIDGFEDYTISSDGIITSFKRKSKCKTYRLPKVKSICFTTLYPTVTLCKNGKMYMFYIHRLLAQHFIPNKDNLPQINHKDGNKHNYNLNNLEWCSQSQNTKHSYDKLERKQIISQPKLKKQVGKYSLNDELIEIYDSINEAELKNNISHISCVAYGKYGRKTSGGYKWKFIQ